MVVATDLFHMMDPSGAPQNVNFDEPVSTFDARYLIDSQLLPTKGNVIVGDGANWGVLGVGADTNVLTADSAQALGVKWAVGGGGGAPVDAQYVTLVVNGVLTNERVLTGTANQIVITDNGAGGTVVLSVGAGLADIAGLAVTDGNIIVGDGANWIAESGATARTSLGLAIGTNVQAYDAQLADLAGLAITKGNIIVADGANWIALGVGADTNVLTADSGEASGVKWAAGTVPWTPYHDTSTIVGWSAYTGKVIYYKKVGKLVFVQFTLNGTSDSTTTSFTVPYNNQGGSSMWVPVRCWDDGVIDLGLIWLTISSSLVIAYSDIQGNQWTASGVKAITGQFWYEAA